VQEHTQDFQPPTSSPQPSANSQTTRRPAARQLESPVFNDWCYFLVSQPGLPSRPASSQPANQPANQPASLQPGSSLQPAKPASSQPTSRSGRYIK